MISTFKDFEMLIDGQLVSTEKTLDVINPATEEVIAAVPVADAEILNDAIYAAKKAFPAWANTPIEERSKLIQQLTNKILEKHEEIAQLLTMEQGKPLYFSRDEVNRAANWSKHTSTLRIEPEILEENENYTITKYYVPIGVTAAIVPWNVPVLLGVFKIANALLMGNTVIYKPSPFTPLTALKIGELAKNILPPGVLNVVTGENDLGPLLTNHPDIAKISFTGSTATGKKIMESAAQTLKRITLELGGNDASIILPDVDIQAILPKLFWAIFNNSGQICINSKRIYVHEAIFDDVVKALQTYAAHIKIGNGLEDGVMMGPVQNKMQFQKVQQFIEEVKSNSYEYVQVGDIPSNKGYFIPYTFVMNPPEQSTIVQEEPFGPIIPIIKFSTVEEAIEKANNSLYGLGASVWTKDLQKANEIALQLEAGTVWVNEGPMLAPHVPFGGVKHSGIGVEGTIDGLLQYTNTKVVRLFKQ